MLVDIILSYYLRVTYIIQSIIVVFSLKYEFFYYSLIVRLLTKVLLQSEVVDTFRLSSTCHVNLEVVVLIPNVAFLILVLLQVRFVFIEYKMPTHFLFSYACRFTITATTLSFRLI